MKPDESDKQGVSRGMTLWALTIALASICYIMATGHDVFDDPFDKVYALFIFVIIPVFVLLQATLSRSFSSGFWRVGAFSLLFTIGYWEEWKIIAVYGVVLLVLYALFRMILDKTNWQARSLSGGLDRLSSKKKWVVLIWIATPIINLIAAITLHPILTEMYSSGGGSPDSIRLYSIRPSLIRRVDMLNWNGLIIFAVISSVALFVILRTRKN